MLVSISTSNFLSFKDKMEFSFVCNDTSNKNTYFSIKKKYLKKEKNYAVNKVSAIYGANASGKTNVLKVISFMKEMILLSHDQNFKLSPIFKPYLLIKDLKQDSDFGIDFFIDDVLYSYSFTINLFSSEITKESLLEYKSQKATTLFKRDGQNFLMNEHFQEGKERKQFVRANSLALSVFSNMSGEISSKIWKYFKEKVHVFQGNMISKNGIPDMTDTINMIDLHNEEFNPFLQKLLTAADININRMDCTIEEISPSNIQGMPNKDYPDKKIRFFSNTFNHYIYDDEGNKVGDIDFNPINESTGTNILVSLSGSLYNVLKEGMALFIDEIDSSLHPILVKEIVSKFNSASNSNQGQLFFTTHDISLLDGDNKLPKDQIWFVDKNKKGESSLYSLDEFNGVNSINSISKAYLLGKFDAIPHVGEF